MRRNVGKSIWDYLRLPLLGLALILATATHTDAAIQLSIVDALTGQNAVQANPGATVTLDIRIDTGTDALNGYSIYLTFDDSVLEVQNLSAPFIQKDFLGGVQLENDTHGDPGNGTPGFQLDYTEGLIGSTKSGSGAVAQLQFKALAAGTATIGFDSGSPRDTTVSTSTGLRTPDTMQPITVTVGQGGDVKSFTILSGNQQTGTVSQLLPQPFVVLATQNGQPMAGASVLFEVVSGGGTLQGLTSFTTTTGATDGQAQALLLLGPQVGTQQVTATLVGHAVAPLTFTATAQQASTQRTLAILSGDQQYGPIGGTLPSPLIVQASEDGQPLALADVDFEVTSGTAKLHTGTDTATQTTDASGQAQASVTLGSTPEVNTIRASLQGGTPWVEFQVTALSNTTDSSIWLRNAITGNEQFVATVGDILSFEIMVSPNGEQVTGTELYLSFDPTFLEVIDQQPGNSGIQPFIAGGTIDGNVNQNASQGNTLDYAETGGTGNQTDGVLATFQLKAKAAIQQTSVGFDFDAGSGRMTTVVHAVGSGPPSAQGASVQVNVPGNRLILVAGDGQTGKVLTSLPSPLVVAVQDPQGNPVAGVSVDFTIQQSNATFEGGSSQIQAVTDDDGQAQVALVLGTSAGVDNTVVQVTGTGMSPITFTATTLSGDAAQLVITSGNQQTGAVGGPLPQPLIVSVFDAHGNSVSDFSVLFQVANTDGSISSSPGGHQQSTLTVKTDTSGKATAYWTLGNTAGDKQLTVLAEGLQGSPVTFYATATAGSGSQIEIVSGNQQTGTVDQPLVQPLTVRVLDHLGNVASQTLVTFTIVQGNGQVNGTNSTSQLSDPSGQAQATLTLGTQAGQSNQQVKAEIPNGESVTFMCSAQPADATKLRKISGDQQVAKVQQQFGESLIVQATDTFDNVVPGASVHFVRTSGASQLLPTNGTANQDGTEVTETTDDSGRAAVGVRAGTAAGAGVEQIEAILIPDTGNDAHAYFSLSVNPGSPDNLIEISGNAQTGDLNTALTDPFIVMIRDAYNNPVPGVDVQFMVTHGDGTLSATSATTDEAGQAGTVLTLGTVAGTNAYAVEARASGVHGSPVRFYASASPNSALSMLSVSGDTQSGVVGKRLSSPLVIKVEDTFHNPIAGISVNFQVTSGGGTLSQSSASTNSDGKAQVEWTLGTSTVVQHTVLAQANGVQNSVQFTASALADSPTQLIKLQGDSQTGVIENALPLPFTVQVRDRYSNQAANAEVVFTIVQGGGLLPGGHTQLNVYSDTDGQAETTLTLGDTVGVGIYKVRAALSGTSAASVEFVASATAGTATAMQVVAGDAQTGTVGQALPTPLQVKVVDHQQNPVSGVSVRFEVRSGSGHFANSTASLVTQTDAEGLTSITFILGGEMGVQNHQVKASLVSDPRVSVLFAASASHGSPTLLDLVGGNNQTGDPNQVLADQLLVELTDAFHNPISQAPIFFQVLSGGGSVKADGSFHTTETVLTNSDGLASVSFKTGSVAGQNVQQVQASLSTNDALKVLFQASVQPGRPTSITKIGGDAQTGAVAMRLGEPLTVAAQDAWGNNVADADVLFRVIQGSGKLSITPTLGTLQQLNVPTDDFGFARAYFTLGTQAGLDIHKVEAQLAGTSTGSVTFTAQATADPGTITVTKLTTGELSGPVNTTLYPPLSVELVDQYGNPAVDVLVTFEVVAGDSYFQGPQATHVTSLDVTTDTTGKAEANLMLGTQVGTNNHTVLAKMSNAPSRQVSFLVSTTAGSVTSLEQVAGEDQTATVGQAVANPLVIRARDVYGNIAVGVEVVFRAVSGGVAPVDEYPPTPRPQLLATTDNNGIAEAIYVLGPQAGTRNHLVEVYHSEEVLPMLTFVASGTADEPAMLSLFAGDQQTGIVGQALPEPLAVMVTDIHGNPSQQTSVQFDVMVGTGTFGDSGDVASVSTTDAEGLASVQFVLGAEAGDGNNMVQASLPGLMADPVLFIASAVPDQGRKLLKVSGDHQVGAVGRALDAPFIVTVRDKLGNVTSGVTVLFEVSEGAGILENGKAIYTSVTDLHGNVQVRLTLGTTAGRENNAVLVSLPDQIAERVTFRASAQPAAPEELVLVSGDNQTGIPGLPLAEPLVVGVVDRYGNPVLGTEVIYSILAGNSSFQGTRTVTDTTDEQGFASALLTLDTKADELQIVQAQAPSIGAEVLFQAVGKAGTPARLMVVAGDSQSGEAGKALASPFIMNLADQHGNPIAGEQIEFQVLEGDGAFVAAPQPQAPQRIAVTTDMLGQASVHYILGTDVNVVNQIQATLIGDGLPHLSVLLTAQPQAATGASLIVLSGDNQTGTVGQSLPVPLIVLVRDQHNNVAPGATVRFEVASGSGQLIARQGSEEQIAPYVLVQADALGQAHARLVLGTEAGDHNNIVLVSPVDFNSPSVHFRASAQPGLAHQLVLVSGNQQEGTVATPLDHALVVQVKDQHGNVVPGIAVDFLVTAGDGVLYTKDSIPAQGISFLSVDSDALGRASVLYQLGPEAALLNQVKATVPGILAEPVHFSALAKAGGEVQIIKQSGDRQIGIAGQPLPRAIEVQLVDQGGNQIADAEVSFVVVDGSGRLEDGRRRYNTFTDSTGTATARWILGNQQGEENNSVQVSALDYAISSVLFKASTEPDLPHRLVILGGDEQRAVAGTVLLQPLEIIVLDRYNNPVNDVVVTLEVAQGSGHLLFDLPGTSSTTINVELLDLYTDADGQVEALYRLGELSEPYTEMIQVTSPSLPGTQLIFQEYKNAPPEFLSVAAQQVTENEFLQFEVLAQDPEGDTLGYQVENLPVGANFSVSSSQVPQPKYFRWRPTYSDAGTHNVTFVATDSFGNSARLMVPITVLDQNRPPVLDVLPEHMLTEGDTFTLALTAEDDDGDQLHYDIAPLPEGAKLDSQAGMFIWLPDFHQAGTYSVQLTVSDYHGAAAEMQMVFTVQDTPKPPTLAPIGTREISEGELIEILLVATNPDGGTLRFEAQDLPQDSLFNSSTGVFRWTPNFAQAGQYQVHFAVVNLAGQRASQNVHITVHDQNQPPEFSEVPDHGLILGDEAQLIEFGIVASDPEGTAVTLQVPELPSGAVFDSQVEATGTRGFFAWRPQYDQAGNYEIEITATDGLGAMSVQRMTLSILNVNRPPSILSAAGAPPPLQMVVKEGQMIAFDIEAADPDGEELSYVAEPLPTDASLEQQRFEWLPGHQQSGIYAFTVTVTDPFGATDVAEAEITVLDENHAPVWETAQSYSATEGEAFEFFLRASDPDGDSLAYTAAGLPSGALFTPVLMPEGVFGWFQWTPGDDQAGLYDVVLTATDTKGERADLTVSITVQNINQPPVLPQSLSILRNDLPLALGLDNDGAAVIGLDEGDTLSFVLEAFDADGDVIQWQTNGLPDGASWTPTETPNARRFEWASTAGQVGEYELTFTAVDTHQATAQVALKVRVRDIDLPPTWTPMYPLVVRPENEVRILLQAIDPDGLSVSYHAERLPSGARVEANQFVWIPTVHQLGSHQLLLVASAGNTESSTMLSIVVNRVPWDVNGDDRVDIFDLVQLGQWMGVKVSDQPESMINDINQDGVIDVLDFVVIGQHFGERLSQTTPAAPSISRMATDLGISTWLEQSPEGAVLWAQIPEDVVGFELEFSATEMHAVPDVSVAGKQWLSIGPKLNQEGRLLVAATVAGGKTLAPLGKTNLLTFTHQPASGIRVNRLLFVKKDGRSIEWLLDVPSRESTSSRVAQDRLLSNYPNPFNPETWIPFELEQPSEVHLSIYDAQGKLVKVLNPGHRDAGIYRTPDRAIYWDGRNDAGEPLASGVYLVRLRTRNSESVRRMVMVK